MGTIKTYNNNITFIIEDEITAGMSGKFTRNGNRDSEGNYKVKEINDYTPFINSTDIDWQHAVLSKFPNIEIQNTGDLLDLINNIAIALEEGLDEVRITPEQLANFYTKDDANELQTTLTDIVNAVSNELHTNYATKDYVNETIAAEFQTIENTGVQGAQGAQGIMGTQGFAGVQGARGTLGAQGFAGVQGAKGIQGAKGTVGDKGAQGFVGTQGFAGVQGANGIQGDKGAQGAYGTQGAKGILGDKGAQGAYGTQGSKGTFGDKGEKGVQGFAGTQGFAGIQGIQGSRGEAGTFETSQLESLQNRISALENAILNMYTKDEIDALLENYELKS